MPDFGRPNEIIIDNSGGTKTLTVNSLDNFYIVTSSGTATLAADCDIVLNVAAPDGTTLNILYAADVIKGAHALTVCGTSLTAVQGRKTLFIVVKSYGGTLRPVVAIDFSQNSILETAMFVDKCVTLSKMADATRGMMLRYGAAGVIETFVASTNAQILIGDGTDIKSVAQSGHVLFANTGQSTIQAGVIVDAMCAAGMALARTKIANGTANHVLINTAGGAMSSEALLAITRGGTAMDTSGLTGFPLVTAGTWSVASINNPPLVIPVSFETGEQCDNTITITHNCTLTATNTSGYVTKAIAATDDATVTLKKNGVAIGSGTITFTASSALNTAGTIGAFSNTAFSTGDTLSCVSSKTTAGGKAILSLNSTRLA